MHGLYYTATHCYTGALFTYNYEQGLIDDALLVREPPYRREQSSEARLHLLHRHQTPANNCPTKTIAAMRA